MKLFFPALGAISAIVAFASFSMVGCLKTASDIPPKNDTTIVTDTVAAPGDTTGRHLGDSLWAYYPLNGNLGDSSGNNHALTLVNPAMSTGVALGFDLWGNPKGALDFGGVSGSYATIADGANFNPSSFSVSMFVMYRQTKGVLLAKINYNDATGATFDMGIDPRNWLDTMYFSMSTLGSNLCSTPAIGAVNLRDPTQNIQLYAWYHVVVTYANGIMNLYMNGALVHTTTFTSTLNWCSGAPFILGNWWTQDNGPVLDGKIDEIRIYTRVLRSSEVAYLYNNFRTH